MIGAASEGWVSTVREGPRDGAIRYPDFLGVGAQKAGTTWLFETLRRHPGIWTPPVKELQFFNTVHLPAHRTWTAPFLRDKASRVLAAEAARSGQAAHDPARAACAALIETAEPSDHWYGQIFGFAGEAQLCGEISPAYALLPPAGIAHARRLMPEAKLLFLIRDPIDRCWSRMRMALKRDPDAARPSAKRDAVVQEAIAYSDYPTILRNWTQVFPADQLYVGDYDRIAAEPLQLLQEVCDFIGADFDERFFGDVRRKVHEGEAFDPVPELMALFREGLEPVYRELESLCPEIGGRWRRRRYG